MSSQTQKTQQRILAELMQSFERMLGRLGRCIRWEGYQERAYQQSARDHTLSMALLTGFMAERERVLGGVSLNSFLLVMHALVHDVGEGIMGDVTYRFKTDPRFQFLYRKLEREETQRQLGEFGPLSPFLQGAYELVEGSEEVAFFDALERLDYLLYALSEHILHGHDEFIAVYVRQHPPLKVAAQHFRSLAEIYPPELQAWVEQQIEMGQCRLTHGAVARPAPCHLDDLLAAAEELARGLQDNGHDGELLTRRLVALAQAVDRIPK